MTTGRLLLLAAAAIVVIMLVFGSGYNVGPHVTGSDGGSETTTTN
jgi:hypothetical protein